MDELATAEARSVAAQPRDSMMESLHIAPPVASSIDWDSAISALRELEHIIVQERHPVTMLASLTACAKCVFSSYEKNQNILLGQKKSLERRSCSSDTAALQAPDSCKSGDQKRSSGSSRRKRAKPLSADEFMPVMIYITSKANLSKPMSSVCYLQYLMASSQLRGEEGYFLASFEGAIQYLLAESKNRSVAN